jgi:alkylated DNA nucleotide flippase Atl1
MLASAERAVAGLTAKYRILVGSGDKTGAAELARQVAGIVRYAGPDANSGWESVVRQPGKMKPPARFRK